MFSNINRKVEFAQKNCPKNGDDGGCEPRMASTVFTVIGFCSKKNTFVQSK